MRKWLAGLGVLIVSALATITVASAGTLELIPNDPQAETKLTALMQPISPFVASGAGNTTAVSQLGAGNYANALTSGSGDLAVISQTGTSNRAVQVIEGNNSAQLLVQSGINNSVLQASVGDENFQAVGVSGSNNSVGYVQIGNQLAGALDVRNSQNTTVMALQTPASGRYLMPVGINGLSNSVVVIVPGRMYVFRK